MPISVEPQVLKSFISAAIVLPVASEMSPPAQKMQSTLVDRAFNMSMSGFRPLSSTYGGMRVKAITSVYLRQFTASWAEGGTADGA